jgi:quinol monooxygenase YgiN
MATASFRIRVDNRDVDEVLHALTVVVNSTRGRTGCLDCHLEKDIEHRGGLRFHSRWDNQDGMRAFIASDHVTQLLQIIELSAEKPEILICCGHESAGLHTLNEIRGDLPQAARNAENRITGCGCFSEE